MKNKTLYFSMALILATVSVKAQDLLFTTTGSCASYLTWNNHNSHQVDSIYSINKTTAAIVVDGDEDAAFSAAVPMAIKKIANNLRAREVLDLSVYPQTEEYGHATFKALWTENGVYMYIIVKDNAIRYQNTSSQWENDAVEFFFSKAVGDGRIQIAIPAMVGTTNPSYPAALNFETGSGVGSNPDYKVFGYDNDNWDISTFQWAIKKTAVGYNMEVYMDKDIVTNGNSSTNYGLNKLFAGDINLDIAGQKQNTKTPALYVREGTLALLGNSSQEFANSNYYGYFKMVDQASGINSPKDAKFSAIYNAASKEIEITSSSLVFSVVVYNVAGQVMSTVYDNSKISVSNLKQGVYMIQARDQGGNNLGVQKVVVY